MKKYLSLAGLLLVLWSAAGHASSGSLFPKAPLSHIAARVVSLQDKYEKRALYAILREADRKDTMKETIQVLMHFFVSGADQIREDFESVDFWGLAVQALFLGAMQRLRKLKKEDEDAFVLMLKEVEQMKDAAFACLQPAVNDTQASPRGDHHSSIKKSGILTHKSFWNYIRLPHSQLPFCKSINGV